jgi:hypothetical protein
MKSYIFNIFKKRFVIFQITKKEFNEQANYENYFDFLLI